MPDSYSEDLKQRQAAGWQKYQDEHIKAPDQSWRDVPSSYGMIDDNRTKAYLQFNAEQRASARREDISREQMYAEARKPQKELSPGEERPEIVMGGPGTNVPASPREDAVGGTPGEPAPADNDRERAKAPAPGPTPEETKASAAFVESMERGHGEVGYIDKKARDRITAYGETARDKSQSPEEQAKAVKARTAAMWGHLMESDQTEYDAVVGGAPMRVGKSRKDDAPRKYGVRENKDVATRDREAREASRDSEKYIAAEKKVRDYFWNNPEATSVEQPEYGPGVITTRDETVIDGVKIVNETGRPMSMEAMKAESKKTGRAFSMKETPRFKDKDAELLDRFYGGNPPPTHAAATKPTAGPRRDAATRRENAQKPMHPQQHHGRGRASTYSAPGLYGGGNPFTGGSAPSRRGGSGSAGFSQATGGSQDIGHHPPPRTTASMSHAESPGKGESILTASAGQSGTLTGTAELIMNGVPVGEMKLNLRSGRV